MSRKIIIDKYQGNTHYSISVFDSYGTEHHFGYCTHLDEENNKELEEYAKKIWSNEVKPEENLLSNAIAECIEIDKKNNIEPNLD
tara:strand:- start:187 stop:441 length:255 start_codon:yes stop_codon:yes gene_type:complete